MNLRNYTKEANIRRLLLEQFRGKQFTGMSDEYHETRKTIIDKLEDAGLHRKFSAFTGRKIVKYNEKGHLIMYGGRIQMGDYLRFDDGNLINCTDELMPSHEVFEVWHGDDVWYIICVVMGSGSLEKEIEIFKI